MAAAAVQQPLIPAGFGSENTGRLGTYANTAALEKNVQPHDIKTTLNYYKAPEDGSPPHATYVDRPETYDRPFETHPVTVHEVAGREGEFSLDGNGFEFIRNTATEKDFLDDDQIKASYYPEVEELLKKK